MIHKIKTLYNRIINKSIKNKDISDEAKIIYAYRYISWALTSIVYLTGKPYSVLFFKLGVILSLLIFSKVIADLYIKLYENKTMIRTLVLIETLGITLLLFPTGGLDSPFIWYALNPTLVAASYLPAYFCWMNLVFYLLAGSAVSYILFNPESKPIAAMFADNSNLILVFALITLVVQLLSNLTKKLYIQTKALQLSNAQKQESMEHVMSLYQVMEALNNHSTKEKLFETLAVYTSNLTKSELCFFWLPNSNEDGDMIETSDDLNEKEVEEILVDLHKLNIDGNKLNEVQEIRIDNRFFLAMPIVSPNTYYGLVAIQRANHLKSDEANQNIKLLEFMAELSAVTLERFNIEDMEDHLLVMEEQNRIANEMHDSVSQRLFSISYAIHGLLGRWNNISSEELKGILSEVKHSSNLAMQELRNCIYRLSSKKKGEKFLQTTLRTYLDSISKLHNIIINFDFDGDETILALTHKKGLTRIIREACGNAIRHGKCHEIYLKIETNREFINLTIIDDGEGFTPNNEGVGKHRGLGISNMRNLVNFFYGNIEIDSEVGKGTKIDIMIPLEEGTSNTHQGGFAI